MIKLIDSNLQKASSMRGLGKYLVLKELNTEAVLMEDLIGKFNQNKVLMEQWKKSMKETQKILVKKKKQKFRKEDVYVVT